MPQVDDEGPLALPDDTQRLPAVENHKKWVDAALLLGCKTIRVNLHGEGSSVDKKTASIDSLSRLGEFAKTLNINIVVENHGSDSSNGAWIAAVMQEVGMSNVGTLPDFGNFCISHPWGQTQYPCEEMYDRYKGVEEMLPFAKGVSAKTYDFDAKGEQPKMDYKRLLDIVKKSGFFLRNDLDIRPFYNYVTPSGFLFRKIFPTSEKCRIMASTTMRHFSLYAIHFPLSTSYCNANLTTTPPEESVRG